MPFLKSSWMYACLSISQILESRVQSEVAGFFVFLYILMMGMFLGYSRVKECHAVLEIKIGQSGLKFLKSARNTRKATLKILRNLQLRIFLLIQILHILDIFHRIFNVLFYVCKNEMFFVWMRYELN